MPGTTSKRHALLVQEQRFLAAAVEHERIAPLQTRDRLALARLLGEQITDRFLIERLRRGGADVDLLRVRPRASAAAAGAPDGRRRTTSAAARQLQPAHGDETRIAGSGADDDRRMGVSASALLVDVLVENARVAPAVERAPPPARRPRSRRAAIARALGACAPDRASRRRATTIAVHDRARSPSCDARGRRAAAGSRRRAHRPARVRRRAPCRPPASLIDRAPAARAARRPRDLDGDDALARRGHAALERQRRRNARAEARAAAGLRRRAPARRSRRRRACAAACRGCRGSARSAPPGTAGQLRHAPHAARADRRRLRRVAASAVATSPVGGRGGQDERVARIFARQHAGDVEAVRQDRRHVLALCTARSIVAVAAARPRFPSRTAACRRSRRAARPAGDRPTVLMTTRLDAGRRWRSIRPATVRACHSAS